MTALGPTTTPDQLDLLPHDDRGGAILAAHWFLTGLATVFLALRIYCKRISRLRLWWDDWVLIAAWVRWSWCYVYALPAAWG